MGAAVPVETHDGWAVSERRYLSDESITMLAQPTVNIDEVPVAITA